MEKIKIYSGKNYIYRVLNNSKTYIVKEYHNTDTMYKETEVLNLMLKNKVDVPRILSVTGNSVALEDLGDVTLLTWLKNEEKNSSVTYHQMLIKLLVFFQEFYRVTKQKYGVQYTLNDISLTNFMIRKDKIYGIDFEMCKEGTIESDIGKLVANIIMYEPVATQWKYRFSDDLIHIFMLNFNIHVVSLINDIEAELRRIIYKRNISADVGDIICCIAEKLI